MIGRLGDGEHHPLLLKDVVLSTRQSQGRTQLHHFHGYIPINFLTNYLLSWLDFDFSFHVLQMRPDAESQSRSLSVSFSRESQQQSSEAMLRKPEQQPKRSYPIEEESLQEGTMNKRPRVPKSSDDSTVRSTESRERTYENHLEHQKSSFDHGTTRENALSAGRVEKLEKEKAVAHEHLRQARQDMHSLAEYSNQCQLERMEGAERNHAQETAIFAASREEQLQTLAAGTARLLTRFQEQAAELADANGKLQRMALLQRRNAHLLKGKTHAEY